MQHTVDTGTRDPMVCCFDPEALPSTWRPNEMMVPDLRALSDSRRLWLCEGRTDGFNQVRVFVEEPVSGPLVPYLTDAVSIERFPVPSGTLWICGAERTRLVLEKKATSGSIAITPGHYHLKAWLVSDAYEEFLDGNLPAKDREVVERLGVPFKIVAFGLIGVSALFIGWLAALKPQPDKVRSFIGAPVLLAILLLAVLYSILWIRKPAFTGKESAVLAIELRRIPDTVVS